MICAYCKEEVGEEFFYGSTEDSQDLVFCSEECRDEAESFERMGERRFGGSLYAYQMWETRP